MDTSTPSFLVVDDEPAVREFLHMVLELRGYGCLEAGSAAEALAIFRAREREIQAVITDLHMPGQDGMSLVYQLQAIRPTLPIAISSGLITSEFQQSFLHAGIRAVLIKPYTITQFSECVQALLRVPPWAAAA